MWDANASWQQAEEQWDCGAEKAASQKAIKGLNKIPEMPGITEETAKNLKWKSFKWMLTKDYRQKPNCSHLNGNGDTL